MGATYWKGVTVDFGAAGNWTNGVPATGTTPGIADGRSQVSMLANLGRGGNLFQMKTTRAYRGDIGGVGNPLVWGGGNIPPQKFHTFRGSGAIHLEPAIAAAEKLVVDTIRGGKVFLTLSQWAKIIVKGGALSISANTKLGTYLHMIGTTGETTIEEQDTTEAAPVETVMTTGVFNNKREFNELAAFFLLSGGVVHNTGAFGNQQSLLMTGGHMRYKPLSQISGQNAATSVHGGLYDFSEAAEVLSWPKLLVGVDGTVKGSALQTAAEAITLDFREDFPE